MQEFQKKHPSPKSVINSFAEGLAGGNYRGFSGDYAQVDMQKESKPLPRRKAIQSKYKM